MQTKLDKAFKIIVDISNRKVTIPQAISWYVTDENIAHLNCQVIDEVEDSIIDIQSYKLSMRVLTPGKILKEVNYTLSDTTNNIFTLTLPDELITEKGRHQCELSIEYLGDKLTSEPFNYNIIQSIANQLDSTISKDSHYPLVLELEDKLKEWNNILDELVSKVIILNNDVTNAEKTRQANEAQRIADEAIRAEFYDSFNDRLDAVDSQLAHNENKLNFLYNTELNINFFEGETKEEKLINMINYAIDNNYKKVFVPAGTYDFEGVISDSILLKESFNKIIIEGENPKTTVFKYNHLYDKAFLKVRGGSGQLCKGYIKNITFLGNDTTSAIELNHVCGYEIVNCIFSTNKIGVLMHNSQKGGFTEFNVVRNCDFYESCNTVLEYKITNNGDRSFHGSGLKECVINQSSTEVNPKIIIGEGCLPYNSPLDGTFFIRCQTPLIKNTGNSSSNFYGNIRTEQFGTSYEGVIASDNTIYFVGGVNALTEITLGTLFLCDRVQLNADGSINTAKKPYTIFKTVTGSLNDICSLESNETIILNICCYGSYWEQTAVYIIGRAPLNNTGAASKLIHIRDFNQKGWGSGSVIFEDGSVKYKNDNITTDSTFNIKATITHIGTRFNYALN
jgi:hypothetical protein